MSGCNVGLGGYGDEPAEFYEAEIRKARKEHLCSECRESILPGEQYEHVAGKWDGDFGTYNTCLRCVAIRSGLSCDGTWAFGSLWEEIHDYVFPAMTTGCLERIEGAAAKQLLIDRWNKWKFERAR